MLCKELESVLESEGLGLLPADARDHLAGCFACQDFLADLSSIVAAAKSIPPELEPPDRIWIYLRSQLQAEGLISNPDELISSTSWWQNFAAWFKFRSLATAAAGIVLFVTAVFLARTPVNQAPAVTAPTQSAEKSSPPPPAPPAPAPAVLAPSPSEAASATLDQTERDVSGGMQLAGNSQVDVSLRQNLQTLDEFIAECQARLRQNPQDSLAREYLNAAYQQKADLLAAMMESGRSEH